MTTQEILKNEELDEELEIASGEHGEIAMILGWHLSAYVYPNKLGRMFDSRTSFEIKPDVPKKEPDISFVAAGRLPHRVRDSVKLAPDLAVEIASPTDTLYGVEEKALEYLILGVRLVWVVRPVTQVVEVYRAGRKTHFLTIEDELDGEDVIPGFKLPITALFEEN